MSDRGGRGASVAMIATSWEVWWLHQSKYHHQGTPRSGARVYTCGYHVAAIPTPAVWRQQLWSAEVVHLEPLAVQTSAAPWYYSPPEQPSTDGTEYPDPLWYCHYQRSLQSRYCHYLITVGGPWEWGQTDPHQPMLGPPLPSGVNLTTRS